MRDRRTRRTRWLAILACWVSPAYADLGDVPQRAAAYVENAATAAYPRAEITVRMVPLDPRVSLSACDTLTLDIPGERVAGRVSVLARCRAPAVWGVYLTALVDVLLPVVTLNGPVPRDTVLRRSDVTLTNANLAELRDGFLTDPDDAIGMSARNNLRADAVLYQRQLAAPKLVSRGDAVTLATRRGSVVVTTQAIALTDGVYGEQVDVRNPRSNRVVSGWVTGPGAVSLRP